VSGFVTPPLGDFQSYATLVSNQGDHLSTLTQWSDNQCANTQGLADGPLLEPLTRVVPAVAQFLGGKVAQGQRGMGVVHEKVQRTSADYQAADQQHAQDLRNIYPAAFPGFPDISALPGGSHVGNFTDEDVKPKEPDEDSASRGIVSTVFEKSRNPDVLMADSLFRYCTGQSIEDLLFKPLTGDWGRLKYLYKVYDALGDGCYTVAGTLRKGSWKLGSEWQGQAATAFDSYLFQWTMGIGGIGDAAKVAAKACKDAYDVIISLVFAANAAITHLIEHEIKALAKKAAELGEGDAAIEGAGLGPEDPLADIGAGIFSAWKLYQIYEIVRDIVNEITLIVAYYEKIKDAVKALHEGLDKVRSFLAQPLNIGSLVNQVEQRGFEFEKDGGWNPEFGAARIGMLPAA
jgi:uncharacterized protein YukE